MADAGQVQAQAARFKALAEGDKQVGGANLVPSLELQKTVIDRFRPVGHPRREAFLRFLQRGGADNHPEVLALFADIGKAMAEDKFVSGKAGAGDAPKSAAEILYPNG